MNTTIKLLATLVLASTVTVGQAQSTVVSASNTPEKAPTKKAHRRPVEKKPSVESQIEELRHELGSQHSQIDGLKQQLSDRDAELQQAQQSAQAAQAAANQEQQQFSDNATAVSRLNDSVADLKSNTTSIVGTIQQQQTQEVKKSELSDLAFGKIHIGAVFYGDWAYYTDTGFGPQFLTQLNQDGPGNAGFNSFDITRTYLNFFYTPNDAVTLRLTPNIYRQVDVSSATANGKGSAIASSSNGNLGFRLKYAYIDFNTLFKGSNGFKKDKLTVGQTTNPLVDWEEGLYGYRYVNLVPWNYLSLSSTYTGITLHGPIEFNGKEYLDYHLGVFNTASFHAIETNDKKQAMGRLTWYPFGTSSDRAGFGVTAFENYGYNTRTPDTKSTPLNRLAVLAHYQSHSKAYLIAGEYDLGRNAFSTGNLFSGASPGDLVGLGPIPFATFSSLASALLAGDRTRQQGFDSFGHARLGHTPFSLFGMYQYFQPNTHISGTNPLDFQRTVGGISYKYNEHFEFSVDDQNLNYLRKQFTISAAQIATFSPSLAAANPNGIANAVPNGTNAIFVNLLFNY